VSHNTRTTGRTGADEKPLPHIAYPLSIGKPKQRQPNCHIYKTDRGNLPRRKLLAVKDDEEGSWCRKNDCNQDKHRHLLRRKTIVFNVLPLTLSDLPSSALPTPSTRFSLLQLRARLAPASQPPSAADNRRSLSPPHPISEYPNPPPQLLRTRAEQAPRSRSEAPPPRSTPKPHPQNTTPAPPQTVGPYASLSCSASTTTAAPGIGLCCAWQINRLRIQPAPCRRITSRTSPPHMRPCGSTASVARRAARFWSILD